MASYWQVSTLAIQADQFRIDKKAIDAITVKTFENRPYFDGLSNIRFKRGEIIFVHGTEFFLADEPVAVLQKFFDLTDGMLLDERTNYWCKTFLHPLMPIIEVPWCEYLINIPSNPDLLCSNEDHRADELGVNFGNCIMAEFPKKSIAGCPICAIRKLWEDSGEEGFRKKEIPYNGNLYTVLTLLNED